MKSPLSFTSIAVAVLGSSLALGMVCAAAPSDAQPTPMTEAWPEPDQGADSIGPLRQAARAGDADAAVEVATRLVDRYERGGATDDLFEATIWIDRFEGSETFARSGLIARMRQNDCTHKVLRLHWLCDTAE